MPKRYDVYNVSSKDIIINKRRKGPGSVYLGLLEEDITSGLRYWERKGLVKILDALTKRPGVENKPVKVDSKNEPKAPWIEPIADVRGVTEDAVVLDEIQSIATTDVPSNIVADKVAVEVIEEQLQDTVAVEATDVTEDTSVTEEAPVVEVIAEEAPEAPAEETTLVVEEAPAKEVKKAKKRTYTRRSRR